jgi:membrane fusion protein, heavy metal efflux system
VKRQVGVGQYIQAGAADPGFAIGDLSTVWVIANVREGDAPAVHLGDPVGVHVVAFPDRIFKANISYVAPSIDPNTHRLTVRANHSVC